MLLTTCSLTGDKCVSMRHLPILLSIAIFCPLFMIRPIRVDMHCITMLQRLKMIFEIDKIIIVSKQNWIYEIIFICKICATVLRKIPGNFAIWFLITGQMKPFKNLWTMGLYIMNFTVNTTPRLTNEKRNRTGGQWVAYPFPHSRSRSCSSSRFRAVYMGHTTLESWLI